jgi:hypothetical protein
VLYQPISCSNGAFVAVSEDEGASYAFRLVKDAPPSNGISGSLQLVMDRSGALYAEWVREDRLQYSVSLNQGRTWGAPVNFSAPGVHQITRPAPAAARRGELGIAYHGSTDAKASKLTLYVTQTANALETDPLLKSAALNRPAAPIYTDAGVTGASPRADYIGAAFEDHGILWAGASSSWARRTRTSANRPPDMSGASCAPRRRSRRSDRSTHAANSGVPATRLRIIRVLSHAPNGATAGTVRR